MFLNSLNDSQRDAFDCLMDVMSNVLVPSNESIQTKESYVDKLMKSFQKNNCNYSPKMHAIHNHFQILLARQHQISDQHGEKVHQTMKTLEERYDGKNYCSLLSDYIWLFC